MTTNSEEILRGVRAERGYTLSYHEVYARLEPAFLEAYLGLYRACTLEARHLTARQRELVWVCLLTAIREEVGSIHVERATAAGVSQREIAAVIRLAGIAETWDAIAFATEHWREFLTHETWEDYRSLLAPAADGLEEDVVHLALAAAHGARRRRAPLLRHLRELQRLGVDEACVAEALSYIMQPVGANTLLWVTDTWLDALRSGELKPSPTLGTADFETRRR